MEQGKKKAQTGEDPPEKRKSGRVNKRHECGTHYHIHSTTIVMMLISYIKVMISCFCLVMLAMGDGIGDLDNSHQ